MPFLFIKKVHLESKKSTTKGIINIKIIKYKFTILIYDILIL